jgi:hypothetical protein
MQVQKSITLSDGREVLATGTICPAEPEVGISWPYIDDLVVEDEDGNDVELTSAEEDYVVDRLLEPQEYSCNLSRVML